MGIPILEDKLVQAGLVRILEAVYEQDFIDDSYGFRPGRSCHSALRVLSDTVENNPVNHIVEADIKGFSGFPLLANICLHYALDLWFEKVFRKNCAGAARLIRYAADSVVCFQRKPDAE